jgi:hypothetical protein
VSSKFVKKISNKKVKKFFSYDYESKKIIKNVVSLVKKCLTMDDTFGKIVIGDGNVFQNL